MKIITIYEHHGKMVHVFAELVGRHRDHCLCYKCGLFKPNQENNCPIAEAVASISKDCHLVLPVWECPSVLQGEPDLSEAEGA